MQFRAMVDDSMPRSLGLPFWELPRQGQDRCLRLLKPKQPQPMEFYLLHADLLNILPESILSQQTVDTNECLLSK